MEKEHFTLSYWTQFEFIWTINISKVRHGSSDSKESPCNVGDLGSNPGLGRAPGGGHGYPLVFFFFF